VSEKRVREALSRALGFSRNRRKGYAVENLAGALGTGAIRYKLSVARELEMEIPAIFRLARWKYLAPEVKPFMSFRPFIFLLALVLPFLVTLNAQEQSSALPKVIEHAEASYPAIGSAAHIQGPVHLKITTDGHAVSSVVVVDGPPLLAMGAANNAKTWKFVDHTAGTFDVTFNFRILEDRTTFFAEPGVVDIAVLPPGYDSSASNRLRFTPPETWSLELKTANDDIKAPLTLWCYGPWLGGYNLGYLDDERQLGDPHIDKDLLGFDALLDDSFNQSLQFSLVGKKSGDKIQGIFLDAWGKSGTWEAVRAVPATANCAVPSSAAEENIIPVPDIVQHRDARYPSLAREAQIQGEVHMRVTADTYCAAKITTDSSEPLLAQAAESAVRNWRFGDHQPGTFDLTFNYRILKPEVSFLEKPGVVEISGIAHNGLEGSESGLWNYGGFEAEVWSAQLTNQSGRVSTTFKFAYGCCEEGRAMDATGKSEKISQGFRDDHDVGFGTFVRLPGGRRTNIYLIGRLHNWDRMQGVFLDEFGISGTWSARLISHGPINTYE
jgi:Gram-negative bacterial TonB protein C-terminal